MLASDRWASQRAALTAILLVCGSIPVTIRAGDATPEIPALTTAMKDCVAKQEIAGAVSLVIRGDKLVHLSCVGDADIAAKRAMTPDTLFWIASMTKPVTACAILMLQDEGKLSVDDPVAKYLPELGDLKTADGKPGKLTLVHLLTHTSGMAEATTEEQLAAKNLAELIPNFAKRPLQFEPGTKWQYCQSGINSLGRIVEVVSGQTFDTFLQKRIFDPLGLKNTTFYPTEEQLTRMVKPYKVVDGKLQESGFIPVYSPTRKDRFPAPNGGLFSTAGDYARFCQMLMNGGSLDGKQYLKPETVKQMATVHSGELKTGFTPGNGWGLGVCVIREPQGVTATLSPGSFGHGGAFGTQGWIDPVKKCVTVLMVQRTNFGNGDASAVRGAFQAAAAE